MEHFASVHVHSMFPFGDQDQGLAVGIGMLGIFKSAGACLSNGWQA
jgi:hypothetical protein